jgi:hypothetical protein
LGTERVASHQNSGSLLIKVGISLLQQRQVQVLPVQKFPTSSQERKLATFVKSLFFFAPRQQRNASSKKVVVAEEVAEV